MDSVAEDYANNSSLKKGFFKGPKATLTLTGILLIAADHVIPSIINELKTKAQEAEQFLSTVEFLEKHSDKVLYAGITTLLLGITLYITFIAMHKFWETHINPNIEEHIKNLKKILEESGNKAQEIINTNSLELAINHSDPDTVKKVLKTAHSKAYGTHCSKPKGLYQAIQDNVGEYLEADKPHRSGNHQHIIISPADNGGYHWKETTTYKLHTIAYDTDYKTPAATNKTVTYPFKVSTSAQYSDLDSVILNASVDNKQIASTAGLLKNLNFSQSNPISLSDGLIKVEKMDDEYIKISIEKDIQINKPEISIKIEEKSTMMENFFVAKRDQPVCGQTVTVEIPRTHKFDCLAVPPNVDEPEKVSDQHRIVRIDGWVQPGIILSCQWSKR